MPVELQVLISEDGADAERLDRLTRFLRQELLQVDVADVTALRAGELPVGARAFEVAAVGGLVVTLGHSVEALRVAVSAIRSWLARGDGARRSVRLEIGDDALELSEASVADQERLVEFFLSRHSTG